MDNGKNKDEYFIITNGMNTFLYNDEHNKNQKICKKIVLKMQFNFFEWGIKNFSV